MEDEPSNRGYPVGHVERKCVRCLENDISFIILDKVNSANLLFEFWSLFFLLSSVKEIKDCNNCGKYSIVHSKDRPLCKWPFVKERRNKFCEEQLSRGTIVTWNNCPECVARDIEGHWYMMVLGQYRVVLAGIWWYWVSMGQYWLLLGDIGSV